MKKLLRKVLWIAFAIFLLANIIAFTHAYTFTHFSDSEAPRTRDAKELSFGERLGVLLTGVDNPRPKHQAEPAQPFETSFIDSNEQLEAWTITVPDARGTVILFHGFAGEKSSLLSRANFFRLMQYNTVLVDFGGSGGSSGNTTTIGYAEAQQVWDTYQAMNKKFPGDILLFGTSMGAASILKAIHDHSFQPAAIILECPFGNLYETVKARFTMMSVPSFPMAALLTFWGGVQHGYWAFGHNPSGYATSVQCPTLLLFGEQDDRVSMEETKEIFGNLRGEKTLRTYPLEGHHIFTPTNETQWKTDVGNFVMNSL